jgi:ribosomal protein S27AE
VKDTLLEVNEVRQTLHECPHCAKRTLVQRSPDKYHCLWCGFRKDLSAAPESASGAAILPLGLIIFAIILLAFSQNHSSRDRQLHEPPPHRVSSSAN